jgi:hypothetical protein
LVAPGSLSRTLCATAVEPLQDANSASLHQVYFSTKDFEQRYRRVQEPHARSWWQILWLLSPERSARQVAQYTGYSPYWIGQLAKRYNREGPDGSAFSIQILSRLLERLRLFWTLPRVDLSYLLCEFLAIVDKRRGEDAPGRSADIWHFLSDLALRHFNEPVAHTASL